MSPISIFLGPAFVMSLLGSGHCALMCGGLWTVANLGDETSDDAPNTTCARQSARAVGWAPSLAVQLGRLTTYAALGAGFATFGVGLSRFLPLQVVETATRLLLFVSLTAAGLQLMMRRNGGALLPSLGGPVLRRLTPFLRRMFPVRSVPEGFLLGLLWGLLPCGLLYSAFIMAMTTPSAAWGAATLLVFGLGTLPALTAVWALARGALRWASHQLVQRALGVALVGVALLHGALGFEGARALIRGETSTTCH
jgi:hypothetical protein